jgi:hypothetical protein
MVLATALLGCAAPAPAPEPSLAWQPPADWVIVSNAEGSFQVTLPPYLEVFDTQVAIFANERPRVPGGPIPIQLWAQGPVLEDRPGPGESLAAWIDRRLNSPVKGLATVTSIVLPLGAGIRYDRVDASGTPNAWRIVVFAIDSPRGIAWLMIDGPPDEWAARADDLERVPFLFRVR